jgi:hypothetical protein
MSGNRKRSRPGPDSVGVTVLRHLPARIGRRILEFGVALRGVDVTAEGGLQS